MPQIEIYRFLDTYFPKDTFPEIRHIKSAIEYLTSPFLSDRFDQRKPLNALYAGCSWTEGGGLDKEFIFPTLTTNRLSEIFGVPVNSWNLGKGSRSNDYISRMVASFVDVLNPDLVFVTFTGISRREYYQADRGILEFGIAKADWIKQIENEIPKDVFGAFDAISNLVSPFDDSVNLLKNYLVIAGTLGARNIPWGFSMLPGTIISDRVKQFVDRGLMDRSRYLGDNFDYVDQLSDTDSHPGIESHALFGERVAMWFADHHGAQLRAAADRSK